MTELIHSIGSIRFEHGRAECLTRHGYVDCNADPLDIRFIEDAFVYEKRGDMPRVFRLTDGWRNAAFSLQGKP